MKKLLEVLFIPFINALQFTDSRIIFSGVVIDTNTSMESKIVQSRLMNLTGLQHISHKFFTRHHINYPIVVCQTKIINALKAMSNINAL